MNKKTYKEKLSKSDLNFVFHIREVIKGLNKRVGKEMCEELHADCFDCRTRALIACLNHWIDIL
jgi:hypothetical protein